MKKLFIYMLLIFILFCGGVLFLQNELWGSGVNNEKAKELFIPSESGFDYVKSALLADDVLKSPFFFDQLAGVMKYKKDKVKSGRYIIEPGMSLRELLSMLRSGNQSAINLTFNNIRTLEELAGKISHQIEADSLALLENFRSDKNIGQKGLNHDSAPTMYIPNTYQVYWDITPQQLVDRLSKEHQKFWQTNERASKAKALGLTPTECSILASIVQKESNKRAEQPIIAGVYLNRLKKGMPLQADPTVVYAVGDFTIKRVLNKHLRHVSPYNTYLNKGLPPGPICIPESQTIDAVLNAQDHRYLYFCAKPGYDGEHLFAKTLVDHNKNARTYQRWLSREGILR